MTLYTKSVYASKEEHDGIRVCVMSRLTEEDGITVVTPLLHGKKFDWWLPVLSPPDKLVGAWYRGELSGWKEFEKQYLDHLHSGNIFPHLKFLANQAYENDMTLLCVEKSPKHCHRSLLAQECQKLKPDLEIIIK